MAFSLGLGATGGWRGTVRVDSFRLIEPLRRIELPFDVLRLGCHRSACGRVATASIKLGSVSSRMSDRGRAVVGGQAATSAAVVVMR